jgi:predicted transcriptional regulator
MRILKNDIRHCLARLPVDLATIETALMIELKLSHDESRVFILIVKNGKMTPELICDKLSISLLKARRAADSLVKKGMLIEVSSGQYESLHPRFAASNGYRILCEEEKIELKKNVKIDNIGRALQEHYENARTK